MTSFSSYFTKKPELLRPICLGVTFLVVLLSFPDDNDDKIRSFASLGCINIIASLATVIASGCVFHSVMFESDHHELLLLLLLLILFL